MQTANRLPRNGDTVFAVLSGEPHCQVWDARKQFCQQGHLAACTAFNEREELRGPVRPTPIVMYLGIAWNW